jgi:hypothetical protein
MTQHGTIPGMRNTHASMIIWTLALTTKGRSQSTWTHGTQKSPKGRGVFIQINTNLKIHCNFQTVSTVQVVTRWHKNGQKASTVQITIRWCPWRKTHHTCSTQSQRIWFRWYWHSPVNGSLQCIMAALAVLLTWTPDQTIGGLWSVP